VEVARALPVSTTGVFGHEIHLHDPLAATPAAPAVPTKGGAS
jgi:hypothetical protein